MKWRSRCRASFGVFLIYVLVAGSFMQAHADAQEPSLWVLQKESGVRQLSTGNGTLLSSIENSEDVVAILYDAPRARLVTLSRDKKLKFSTISTYGANGTQQFSHRLDIKESKHDKDKHEDLERSSYWIVGQTTGDVWLALPHRLVVIDSNGQVVFEQAFEKSVDAVAENHSTEEIWIAVHKTIYVFDKDRQLKMKAHMSHESSSMAYIDPLNEMWIVQKQKINRYNASVELQGVIKTKHGSEIAYDGDSGIWLSAKDKLLWLDLNGVTQREISPFDKKHDDILSLLIDSNTHTAWVSSKKAIANVQPTGETRLLIDQKSAKDAFIDIALVSDSSPPVIRFSTPMPNSYLATLLPDFAFEFSDSQSGINLSSLEVRENGLDLPVTCQTYTSNATCTSSQAMAEGEHSVTATIRDMSGNISDPAQIHFTIDSTPPTLSFVNAHNNQQYNVTTFTLEGATSEPGELYLNETKIDVGIDGQFTIPIELIEGANVLAFLAIDLAGNRSSLELLLIRDTTAPVAISEYFLNTEKILDNQFRVYGNSGSVEAGVWLVVTNTRTGETWRIQANADGGFSLNVTAITGDEITVSIEDEAGNVSVATQTTLVDIILSVTSPANGALINSDRVTIKGTYSGPKNTSLTVNGVKALIINGAFVAVDVPLVNGQNTLTLVASTLEGAAVSKQFSVMSTGEISPVKVAFETTTFFAPTQATFSITLSNGRTITQVESDYNVQQQPQYVATNLDDISHVYNTDGFYQQAFRVTDDAGQTYEVFSYLLIENYADVDAAISEVFNGMNSALLAGNKSRALHFIVDYVQPRFEPVLEALLPDMAAIVDSYSPLYRTQIDSHVSEYVLLRQIDGETHAFFVYFKRSGDGLWRLDSM